MIYHFIVNPRARSGLGEMLWKQLEPELCRKRIDYQIHLTTKKKDAGKIASEITEDGQEHMFVVLGGDGTLNEVLSGIKSLEKVTLGYIPIGSSNDFARGTGIPGDPFKALDTILSPKRVEKMDWAAPAPSCAVNTTTSSPISSRWPRAWAAACPSVPFC